MFAGLLSRQNATMAEVDIRGQEFSEPFRPRARLLQLLGDELIGSPRLAVFELVKNAYDADATEVVVRLDLANADGPTITVCDDGEGMSPDTLRDVWMVPGNEHRSNQRQEKKRSTLHNRLPLGEKGLGRFAVHKLGNRIRLITRARDSNECVVDIDWNELIRMPFLDEALVTVQVRQPEVFTGEQTGTRIEVSELRPPEWSRGEVRQLYKQIASICSPFEDNDDFRAVFEVPGKEDWVKDLPDFTEILARAMWKFCFSVDNKGRLDFTYKFRPAAGFNLDPRTAKKTRDPLPLPVEGERGRKIVADEATMKGIGPVEGVFHVFDRDRAVLKQLGDTHLMANYLNQHGGVRVYRDGIRVYNYGEAGDDWLGLDLRRVNVPTRRISRNIILGAVHLSLEHSRDLREKTNREGFIENDACTSLRRIVLGALGVMEAERRIDKDRLRHITEKLSDTLSLKVEKPISKLRDALKRHGPKSVERFEPYVAKIERDYQDMQETLLTAGMSGLNLAVLFHEVDRGVRALCGVIVDGGDLKEATRQAEGLVQLLDGFTTLLRRNSKGIHDARSLVTRAHQSNLLRLRYHRIGFESPLLGEAALGFKSRFAFGLVLGALNNLIDNALYWLRLRWPDLPAADSRPQRQILIDTTRDLQGGPAIVVADNGVGFQDAPEILVRPFFTRKPTGMGLGLYYANLAMELSGGRLAFPTKGEVEVPPEYDGAVVAMIFKQAD